MNSLHIAAALFVASVLAHGVHAATGPLSADQQSVLEAARAHALQYTQQLPDFICTQITHRTTSGLGRLDSSMGITGMGVPGVNSGAVVSSDTVEEKLTYFNQEENYTVIAINGKKVTGTKHTGLAGAVSAGEFGSAMHEIFDLRSHTVFTWDRMAKLRGHRVYVFAINVPRGAGTRVFDKRYGKEITASYSGQVFVDADTKEVLRTSISLDLPAEFPIKVAERFVDYEPISIAGKKYNLPFHSEVSMQDSAYLYVNRIDFKHYRKFEVESTIRFGSLAVQSPFETAPKASNSTAKTTTAPSSPVTSDQNEQTAKQSAKAITAGQPQSPPVAPPVNEQIAATEPSQPTANTAAVVITAAENTPPTSPSAEPKPTPQSPAETPPASQPQPPAVAKAEPPQPAIGNATNAPYQLRVRVDLVMVPVVVRDATGKAVGGLTREDFQLFDKGKRQQISSFTVETRRAPAETEGASGNAPVVVPENQSVESLPTNHIVYLFDDLHLGFGDLVQVREAAARHINTLKANDQAAILSTSGLVELQFTSDHTSLNDTLLKLRANPLGGPTVQNCPQVSYFQADQMLNRYSTGDIDNNPPLQAAVREAMVCLNLRGQALPFAVNIAINAAKSAETAGEQESRGTLLAIRDVVRWLSRAPGKKTIILVSPGFLLTRALQFDEVDVIDQAIHDEVAISALDARGLYTLHPAGDTSERSLDATATRIKAELAQQEAAVSSNVLEEMAAGTGGNFVQNTNDLLAGFQRLATPPEYTYLLGFKPGNLKLDGSFHSLKVKLNTHQKLTLQARRGYYAAKQ